MFYMYVVQVMRLSCSKAVCYSWFQVPAATGTLGDRGPRVPGTPLHLPQET